MLELANLSGPHKILNDISLAVNPGELIVITGPNGSGKSTLAEVIAGIKIPSSGKIILDGADITKKSVYERANLGIAYSFQQPVHFKGLTIRDLLQVAITDKDTPEKLLKSVGLAPEEYLDREINSSLSGGELKRIEIASVLARKAKLTIFDEPEAGIDIWSFDNLIKIFRKMHENLKSSSTIIISHQKQIMKIADRVILLKDGKIDKIGPANKMLTYIERSKE